MINALISIQIATFIGVIVSAIHTVRLHFLSKAIHFAIDETFERRRAALNSGVNYSEVKSTITYPDVDATFDNLKWYRPWQRPSTLIVYDKEYKF